MKKVRLTLILTAALVFGASAARANLDDFLSSLNVQARADEHGFGVKLSAQFGVPMPRVEAILHSVDTPADAFMCLQVGQFAGTPPESVVKTYKRSKGHGWGAIAKELGIKPGSAEFHALKRGDLAFTGEPANDDAGGGHGKGGKGGKGKGHKKK